MMNFSKTKDNNYSLLPFILIGLASLIYYLYCWYLGNNQAINWQILSELSDKLAIIDRFEIGNQAFEIPAKVYYVTEQYVASTMRINEQIYWLWLVIFALVLSIISAISTRLLAHWYFVFTTIIIVIMASLGIDALFGGSNYLYSGIILFTYISISYLLNFYFLRSNFWLRLVAFFLFYGILAFTIFTYTTEPKPFLLLAAKSIPAALFLTILFIFFIGYDIILAVLSISTKGGGSNSLLNFSIFTLVYLINIGLTHLHNIKWLQWDILYVSPFLLLVVSLVLSYIFLEKKKLLFHQIFKNISDINILFLGLATITLSICSFGFATANDPLVEAIEDSIIYIHFVMGFCFFAYVFFNFYQLFRQQYDVAKVVFKPLQFAMYYFRGAAILVIFAMLINNQFFPAMQSLSGYYNAMADHAVATKQYKLAEAYYKTAIGYERQNHKSNYGMASLAAVQEDNPTAGAYFRLAIQKKPSEYAFAALSNSLKKEDLFFEAMFALKDGLKIFPQSGELQNNLALLFEQSKLMDSAFIYLEKAKLNAKKPEIIEANIIALKIKTNNLETEIKKSISKYNALAANNLAYNLLSENSEENEHENYQFDGDSTLNMANFAWLSNQIMKSVKSKKYTLFDFQKIIENEGNFNIQKDLRMAQIFNEYYNGNKLKALEILENINANADTTSSNKYDQILFNTLIKKAKDIPSKIDVSKIRSNTDVEIALKVDPLNEQILERAVLIFNKNKKENEAYQMLLTAKHWLVNSPRIQKLYIMQCFKIHMTEFASDGMEALKRMNVTEYKSFLPAYQAQITLMEKDAEAFK